MALHEKVYISLFVEDESPLFGAAAFVRSQIEPLGVFEGNVDTDAVAFETWLNSVSEERPVLLSSFEDALTVSHFSPLFKLGYVDRRTLQWVYQGGDYHDLHAGLTYTPEVCADLPEGLKGPSLQGTPLQDALLHGYTDMNLIRRLVPEELTPEVQAHYRRVTGASEATWANGRWYEKP